MNLRSALHFIQLRSAPNAHLAIRRVSARIREEIGTRYPLFSRYFQSDQWENLQDIENNFFTATY
jgi:thymidylate synthase ThyX